MASLGFVTPAQANHVLLVGAADFTAPAIVGYNTVSDANGALSSLAGSGRLAMGGGALVSFPLGSQSNFEFEFGLIYAGRSFVESDGGSFDFSYTGNTIQNPILLRYGFTRFMSLGVGFYGSLPIGDLVVTQNGQTKSESYADHLASTLPLKTLDYGGLASVRFNVPITAKLDLMLDGRYLMSLSNSAVKPQTPTGTATSYKFNDLQLLAGVSIVFGSK